MIIKFKPIKDNTLKECVKNYGKMSTSAFKAYCLARDGFHREAKKDIVIKKEILGNILTNKLKFARET